jgi:hypothetical protein
MYFSFCGVFGVLAKKRKKSGFLARNLLFVVGWLNSHKTRILVAFKAYFKHN